MEGTPSDTGDFYPCLPNVAYSFFSSRHPEIISFLPGSMPPPQMLRFPYACSGGQGRHRANTLITYVLRKQHDFPFDITSKVY